METTGNENKTPRVTIAEPQSRQAHKAINTMFAAYGRKGGVKDLSEKLNQATDNLASSIYSLAEISFRLGQKSPRMVKAYFQAMCRDGETAFKEEHKVENVAKELPVWPVYKSEILRAIIDGIHIDQFETYSAMKAARIEKNKKDREIEKGKADAAEAAKRGARTEGNTNRPDAGMAPLPENVNPELQAVVRMQTAVIGKLDSKQQTLFAQELSRLVAKYSEKLAKAEETAAKGKSAAPPIPSEGEKVDDKTSVAA